MKLPAVVVILAAVTAGCASDAPPDPSGSEPTAQRPAASSEETGDAPAEEAVASRPPEVVRHEEDVPVNAGTSDTTAQMRIRQVLDAPPEGYTRIVAEMWANATVDPSEVTWKLFLSGNGEYNATMTRGPEGSYRTEVDPGRYKQGELFVGFAPFATQGAGVVANARVEIVLTIFF